MKIERLDKEWLQLIIKAKEMGYSLEEIRSYLLTVNQSDHVKGMKK